MQGFRVEEKMKNSGTQELHGICLWGLHPFRGSFELPMCRKTAKQNKKKTPVK